MSIATLQFQINLINHIENGSIATQILLRKWDGMKKEIDDYKKKEVTYFNLLRKEQKLQHELWKIEETNWF